MPLLRPRTYSSQQPTLFIKRTQAARWPVEWAWQHWHHHSEGNVIERSRPELMALAKSGHLYQGERYRGVGNARDLLCSSAAVTDRVVNHSHIGELGFGIVSGSARDNRLMTITTAAASSDRLVLDDRPLVALTAVASASALGAQHELLQAGAIRLTVEEARERHPDLASFFGACIAHGAQHGMAKGDPTFWLFGREAIRHQLNLTLQATSSEGLAWGRQAGVTVRIEGDLAHFKVRELMERMVLGQVPLPIDILD